MGEKIYSAKYIPAYMRPQAVSYMREFAILQRPDCFRKCVSQKEPRRRSSASSRYRRCCPAIPGWKHAKHPVPEQAESFSGEWCFPLKAKSQIFLHLLNAHAAIFQIDQTVDSGNIPAIEYSAVVFIPLYIGDDPLLAVEFQGLVGHMGLFTGLHHGIE